ncbi:uncharacterized protein A4U43_C05F11350 [Asparagus officinalis]|uniref:Uncharacterized protein n=1 Tax=Asparagus officinalis TaxID=4686 RepID=A0A5P1ERY6_ASPOF|nr:uncharacterized protein A4U43_C05F11350 [Asparagus officinalis]
MIFIQPKEVKVTEVVTEKKKGRKRREESDKTLKEFVQGLWTKSQKITKKPKFLESPFQTDIPKKRSKGKKVIIVLNDDEEKGEKDEEKELTISHEGMRTSMEELWRREKTEEEKNLLGMLNMGIPSPQDFGIRLPGAIEEGFYHNFTVQDVPDVSDDENKWLQHFLSLKVDKKRTVYEVDDQTINIYDMLHLLHGGRLKGEVILEGREAINIEDLQKESKMLWARLAAQIICEDHEWKKLQLKLDIYDLEYLLYFGDNDVPLIEWKY